MTFPSSQTRCSVWRRSPQISLLQSESLKPEALEARDPVCPPVLRLNPGVQADVRLPPGLRSITVTLKRGLIHALGIYDICRWTGIRCVTAALAHISQLNIYPSHQPPHAGQAKGHSNCPTYPTALLYEIRAGRVGEKGGLVYKLACDLRSGRVHQTKGTRPTGEKQIELRFLMKLVILYLPSPRCTCNGSFLPGSKVVWLKSIRRKGSCLHPESSSQAIFILFFKLHLGLLFCTPS